MAEYASGVGFRCLVGHCYERDEPFPFPVREIIEGSVAEAGLDDFDSGWETMQLNWRRSLQASASVSGHSATIGSAAGAETRHLFQSVSDTTARALKYVRNCT